MRLFRYTMFLSILISIFFVVYQQSDRKGFSRLRLSLKKAAIIAAILVWSVNNFVKAIEVDVPNNSTSIEKVLSNQELGSLDDPNSRVVLVKTDNSLPYFNLLESCWVNPNLSAQGNPGNSGRRVVMEKFEANGVRKLVNKTLKNQDVAAEYDRVKERLKNGVDPVKIGANSAPVAADKVLIKGKQGGRYLVQVEFSKNQVNVLGICYRGNQKTLTAFVKLMKDMYGVDLHYGL